MIRTLQKKRWFFKAVSLLLCQLMMSGQTVLASAKSSDKIRINRKYGKVISSKYLEKSRARIIHIQDAHCNEEAQLNIANILNDLVKNYDIKLVGVEGAQGKFDTGRVANFPNKEVLQDVTKYFLKNGKICGSEYFSINKNAPDILLGVEDKNLYNENYNFFMKSLNVRDAALQYFRDAKKEIKLIQEKYLSRDIKKFNDEIGKYRENNDFVQYAGILQKYSKEHGISLDKFGDLMKFIQTMELEQKIDFDKINAEKNNILDNLSAVLSKSDISELLQKDLFFKINRISPAEYYDFLSRKAKESNIDLAKYPNFSLYTDYLSSYDSINQKSLFKQADGVLEELRAKLSKTPDDITVSKLIENSVLLEKYMTLTMSTDELKKSNGQSMMSIDEFNKIMESYCRKMNVDCADNTALLQVMVSSAPMLEKFYEAAKKRDSAMVENLLAEMDLEGINTAILIAGGFHSEGIIKYFEEKGISYDLVIPEITKEQQTSNYFSLMANIKSPFEQKLAENTLQLALKTAKMNLLDQADQMVFAKELDSALAVLTADTKAAQSMSEAEMIDHVNKVMDQYGNTFNIRVLGRVSEPGVQGYRGYLVQIGKGKFTFKVQDAVQYQPSQPAGLDKAEIGNTVVTVMEENGFAQMLAHVQSKNVISPETYQVALSAGYRRGLANQAIQSLLENLFNMEEITPSDIKEQIARFGVDISPEIKAFLSYFIDKGLLKFSEGLEEGEKVYTWHSKYANLNITEIGSLITSPAGETNGALLTAREVRFFSSLLNDKNKETTGNIKLYYLEKGLPLDIQYRLLAELYDGNSELFSTEGTNSVEFPSVNGNIYEIRVTYRPQDKGYFVRVGLKESPATPLPAQVNAGKALIDSPVISLEREGVKVAASNPFDYPVVGVPKFYIEKNVAAGTVEMVVKVLSVDKSSRSVTGIVENLEIRTTLKTREDVSTAFRNSVAQILRLAEQNQIGLLRPILDQSLRTLIPPDVVDRSMLGVGINYPETKLGSIHFAGALPRIETDAYSIMNKPQALADMISILYTMTDKEIVDRNLLAMNKAQLINMFYDHAIPMIVNAVDILRLQYGLQAKPLVIDLQLAPGAIAESHKTQADVTRLVLNAHALRSPGLLFAQIEHELRHEFVKDKVISILNNLMPAQVTPRMIDFITELYISSKELERYDQFGLEAELGLKTLKEIKSPDNPIDADGEFLAITQLSGADRLNALLDIVSRRFFPGEIDALPAPSVIQQALAELSAGLKADNLDGNFRIFLNQKGSFALQTESLRNQTEQFAARLVNDKAAVIPHPETVIISPSANIGNLTHIGSDSVIYGDNISIGRKTDIGKGVKIISDGGVVEIEEGVKIDDGVIIKAKVGEVIRISAGTYIMNGSMILGNVTIGAGAVIDQSTVKNAVIDSSQEKPTEIRSSLVWGETSKKDDQVIIQPGVKIYYSEVKTISDKKSAELAQKPPHPMFMEIMPSIKYTIYPRQTIISSGAVIEKAGIVNSEIGASSSVRENAQVTHSIMKDKSVARVNARINLTYMGRATELGSTANRCYFGDGSKSEHQGSRLENLVMPNEYVIVDERGEYKKILVPNSSNIGAGTIVENNTQFPVVGYNLFTGVNSKITTRSENTTSLLPFTLTKGLIEGLIPPFAYSQEIEKVDMAWMLNNYAGALINHYKKTKELVEKLKYPMEDFDQLFVGSLRLALKLVIDELGREESRAQEMPSKEIQAKIDKLKTAKYVLQVHLASGAWEMKNGEFVNGMFKWHEGDKWTTPALDTFAKMTPQQLEDHIMLAKYFSVNLKVPGEYVPEQISGNAEMGTDGLRGVAQNSRMIDDSHITPSIGYRLGLVAALYAANRGKNVVYVGGDTRESREYLLPSVIWGARSMGMTIKHHQGFIDHTPAVQYKVMQDNLAGGGIIVTASHNPAKDNGIKLLSEDGSKIPEQWEKIADRIINAKDLNRELALVVQELGGRQNFQPVFEALEAGVQGSTLSGADILAEEKYIDDTVLAMKALMPPSDTMRVFRIDVANGAGARIMEKIAERVNATIPNFRIELINQRGVINERVGAEYIHKTLSKDIASGKPLPQWLEDNKDIEMGTLDGDADRNLLFRLDRNNNLQVVDGDKFAALKVYVLDKYIKELGLQDRFQVGVAQTVLANMGSAGFFNKIGVAVQETKVGDKYVRDAAVKWAMGDTAKGIPAHGVAVYYEAAGHGSIIMTPDFINAVNSAPASRAKDILQAMIRMQNMAGGDGIRNLLLFRALMELEHFDFAKLNDSRYMYSDIPKIELEFKVKNKNNLTSVENLGKELTGPADVKEFVAQRLAQLRQDFQAKVDAGQIDESTLLVKDFRIIVRASGTSPKARVQVDGPDASLIEDAAYEIAQKIYDSPSIIGDQAETPPIKKLAAIKSNRAKETVLRQIEEFQRTQYPAIFAAVDASFSENAKYAPVKVEGKAEVGTDGIRGKASPEMILSSKNITPVVAYRMGISAALHAFAQGKSRVYVSGDTRPSTAYLMEAFVSAVQQLGLTVVLGGPSNVASTPQVQMFTRQDPLSGAGGIISASHNPASDNGIKLIDPSGNKFSEEWELITNEIVNSSNLKETIASILSRFPRLGTGDQANIQSALASIGAVQKAEPIIKPDIQVQQGPNAEPSYVDRVVEGMVALLKTADKKAGVQTFTIDAANGAGSYTVLQIAERINALQQQGEINFRMEVINTSGVINDEVGAEFIHKELGKEIAAGKHVPQWLDSRRGQELGTLDGDADRNLFFRLTEDNELEVIDGDKFAALKVMVLNKYINQLGLQDQFKVGVAQTVLANMGARAFFDKIGVQVQETKVGDKYVRQAALDWTFGNPEKNMPAHGVGVYYEAAGHGSILFSDNFIKAVNEAPDSRAKTIIQNIIKLQNEAGGDGIMNLVLFRMLMEVENLTFDMLQDNNFLYADMPKLELELRVEHKDKVTSVGNLGKELTGPPEIVDFVNKTKQNIQAELDRRLASGELTAMDLPSRDFRIIVRASGTSPKMRVQVDGPVADIVEKATYEIMQAIYDSPTVKGVTSEPRPMDKYNAIVENRKNKMMSELTVNQEDGAKYIFGWDKLTADERLNILLDLSKNGFTSEKLAQLVNVHKKGGETAVEPPEGQATYDKPGMKDISRANLQDRNNAVQIGSRKENVDRSALVIIAGGDGGRLLTNMGFTESEKTLWSKPTIPVTAVTQKPPLQRILETMARVREDKNSEIPVVVVVGPKSKGPIENFLRQNNYFGIDNIVVVEQGKNPVMKVVKEGQDPQILLTPDKKVEYSPDGTGGIVDIMGASIEVKGDRFDSIVDYLQKVNRDKVIFWQGDVAGLTTDLFYGILGVSKGLTGTQDMDVVGLAYPSTNKGLGSMVMVNGQVVLTIESVDRSKFPGLEAADDTTDGKMGLPRNSGGYMMSLNAINQVMGNFPIHLQVNKDVNAIDLTTGSPIAKADKFEKFFPDIFPLIGRNPANQVIIAVADENDMVPQKSIPQLHQASIELVAQDKNKLQAMFPMTMDPTSYVELSPLFTGSFGTGVVVGPKVELYVGKNLVVGNNVIFGNNVSVRGENIHIGNNVIIADGSRISAEGNGRLIIENGAVIEGNVNINIKDNEVVRIGANSRIYEGATISGHVIIGEGTVVKAAQLLNAQIGNNSLIEDSMITGLAAKPVIIGNNVNVAQRSILTNVPKGKSWSFLEKSDIRPDFTPTDEFVLRRYAVKSEGTIIGDNSVIKNARLTNTTVGSNTTIHYNSSVEHSVIGNNSEILSGANITTSRLGNHVIVGSEVSKSYFGDGIISRDSSSYVSTIAPNEFIIADKDGNISVLPIPNPTIIGNNIVFANYGGKPLPDMSGSLKGTSIVYAANINNANVINLYDHPDIQLTGLPNEPDVTVIFPFAKVPGGEVWGTIYPFTEASTLSPAKHKIGSVLETDPAMIVNMVSRIRELLPDDQKGLADKVVEGSLWLGVKMLNEQINILKARLDKKPDDQKAKSRLEQLQRGLDIYMKHLDGRWADPLSVNFSGISMSNFDPARDTIDFVRVYGNPNILTLEDRIMDAIVNDKESMAEIKAILGDIQMFMKPDEKKAFDAAFGPQGSDLAQVKLFNDIARDRLKQVRNILSSQYHGIENMVFVVALGTEKLAQRNFGADSRIVINANALRSPFLLFSQAEHEVMHEFFESAVNNLVDNSSIKQKQIVEAVYQQGLVSEGISQSELPRVAQERAAEFYAKLKEFAKEKLIIYAELNRILSLPIESQGQAISVLRDPANPIDLGSRFADLIELSRGKDADLRFGLVHKFVIDNYQGMGIVQETIDKLKEFKQAVSIQGIANLSTDDFDLISKLDKDIVPLLAEFLGPLKVNEGFILDLNEAGDLISHDVTTKEDQNIKQVAAISNYDIATIDFDVFGDSKITDSNSLYLSDSLNKMRENSYKNGRTPKIVIFSLTKDANTIREFLSFHRVDPADIHIIDRNDIVSMADSFAQQDDNYKKVYNILNDARRRNDYSALEKIYANILKSEKEAVEFGSMLMKVLFRGFGASLNLTEVDSTEIKFVANKEGLVKMAVENNLRAIEWSAFGSEMVKEGEMIEAGIDNLLLLQVLEPGSEVPRELVVSNVAKDKVINGKNVYEIFMEEKTNRQKEGNTDPVTIEFIVNALGVNYLTKEDIKGISVKAPKRKIDKEFMNNLQTQRIFDQSA